MPRAPPRADRSTPPDRRATPRSNAPTAAWPGRHDGRALRRARVVPPGSGRPSEKAADPDEERRRRGTQRGSQGGSSPPRSAANGSPRQPPGNKTYMINQPTGAATSSESSRSMTPPCPGRKELMSLIPRSLLIMDSIKSPQLPTATRQTLKMMPTQNGTWRTKIAMQMPATVANTSDPATPSHDFFGLIFGAIGCLPKSTPATYPPVSLITTINMKVTTRRGPRPSASIKAANDPSSGT